MNYEKSEDESSKVESWVHQTVNVNLSSENIFLKPSESIDAFGKKIGQTSFRIYCCYVMITMIFQQENIKGAAVSPALLVPQT